MTKEYLQLFALIYVLFGAYVTAMAIPQFKRWYTDEFLKCYPQESRFIQDNPWAWEIAKAITILLCWIAWPYTYYELIKNNE